MAHEAQTVAIILFSFPFFLYGPSFFFTYLVPTTSLFLIND